MKWLAFVGLLLPLATSCASVAPAHEEEARSALKKWGLAYCLSKVLPDGSGQDDAARSMGAYFELGRHDDEAAYSAVREYFDAQLLERPNLSKEPGVALALVPCLDSYESSEYRALVRAQDRFVGR